MNFPIYLDYNATTPVDQEVVDLIKTLLSENFGNPSSSHNFGRNAKEIVENSRKKVAKLINAQCDEIIFTSGGSESNNLAIKGFSFAHQHKGNHIIISQIEHPAVTEVCKYLENNGFRISRIGVNQNGIIELSELKQAICESTILISVMLANNEVGSIQPIEEICKIAHLKGIAVHTDSAQAVGKIPVDVKKLDVDLLSIAGHKMYAPKGIGALYIKKNIAIEKLIHGANHEMNLRAGTENVSFIAGFAKACEIATRDFQKNIEHNQQLIFEFTQLIKNEISYVKINSQPELCLPNTASISFPQVDANLFLHLMPEIAASPGAACHSGNYNISEVLKAMKVPENFAKGTIRFSVGKFCKKEEIEEAAKIIVSRYKELISKSFLTNTNFRSCKETDEITSFSGCACKIPALILKEVLSELQNSTTENTLVDFSGFDDATIYKLNESQAIVQSVDFIKPVVANPYLFGAISAANSLSDIYAMNANPVFALGILQHPANENNISNLKQILKGASDKCSEAGISISGGHSIQDSTISFGLVVNGLTHPQNIWKNSGAKLNDVLILTKPIGTGILISAYNQQIATKIQFEKVVESMLHLNKASALIMRYFPITSCTDVSGFGLIGHLKEMMNESEFCAEISFVKIPLFEGVIEYLPVIEHSSYFENNWKYASDLVENQDTIGNYEKYILSDAQTSGGLLFTIAEEFSEKIINELVTNNIQAKIIGKIVEKNKGKIKIN